jgi:hypothetical protein
MAHIDIPLDLPHAARLAERIQHHLERYCEEMAIEAPEVMDQAEGLSNFLFRFSDLEENPPEAYTVRDEAAALARELVDSLERSNVKGDRLGQFVRNLFECLELGEEGAQISLRAGENPESLQRPY